MPTTSDTALGRKLLAGPQAASKNVDGVKTSSSPSLSSSSSSSSNKPNKPDPPSPFWTDWEASVDYVSSNLPEEEWVVLDEQLGLLSLSSSSPAPFQTTIKSPTDTSTTSVETSPSTIKAEILNEASSIKVPSIQLCVKDATRASFKSSRGANRRPSTQCPSPSSSSVKKSSPPTRTILSKKTTKTSSNAIKEDVVSKNAKAAPRPHSALSRPPKVKVDKNNLIQVLEEESSSKKLNEPKALLPLLTKVTGSKNYGVPTDNKENNGAGGRGRAPAAAHVASKNHRRRHQHGPPSAPSTKLERQQQDHHYPPRYDSMLQHYHKLQQLNQELRSCVTLVE